METAERHQVGFGSLIENFCREFFWLYLLLKNDLIMAKSKDQKKEVKKQATKTKAEKRAETRDKKPKYD